MGHVFRINKAGNNANNNLTTIVDWSSSAATTYTHGFVDGITDTTTTQREITSIPSPFARIELVKEAFMKVLPNTLANSTVNQVKEAIYGRTIYHKMVSDTLDVAQLFFSYPNMKDKLEIIVWDRNKEIANLKNSHSTSHQLVGKTLEMFLNQDSLGNDPYNFGKMQNLYILKYKGVGQRQMHIIGATSPATLFFSTANDESNLSKQLCFGIDYAFDNEYASLDKRDPEFIKYLFAFRFSNPHFNAHYPEVSKYLDAIYYILDNNLQNEINAIQASCQAVALGQKTYVDSNYDYLDVAVSATTSFRVEINGIYYHCKKPLISGNSDFEIVSTIPATKKPLVLPVVNGSAYDKLLYVGCKFGRNFSVPYYDSTQLSARKLPGINIQYPYLTISDFLEDKIIKLPNTVNKQMFFDGNYFSQNEKKEGYLIPVTDTYFDYFTVEDLMGTSPSGKKTMEIKQVASGVEVTLRIPIQKNHEVEYKRIYTLDVSADKANNKGAIVTSSVYSAVGVLPPVKFVDDIDAHYRIVLISDFNLNQDYTCNCHDKGGFFTPSYVKRNIDIEDDYSSKVYCIDGRSFDFARIGLRAETGKERIGSGLLIPKFKQRIGSGSLTFAIDLGTSNTHIEYTDGPNSLPKPFEYGPDQQQISLLFTPVADIIGHIRGEFLPESIGSEAICQFPMRTVLCIDKNNAGINGLGNGAYVAFGNASPAFMYNKIVNPKYNNFIPNLKWSQITYENEERIRCYIESLFMMIRTKVVQMGASLSQTQIKWFYPISMSPNKLGMFQRVWTDAYHKYFNPTGSPMAITESVAPYSFFQKTRPDVSDIVTIDIGGGTTDVVVADSHGVKCISSMRFAADAIFGSTLVTVQNGKLNGIIRQFKDQFITDLENTDLKRILVDLTDGGIGNSSEVASFLFSLSDNDEIKKKNLTEKVNFNSVLMRDNSQKIVFFIFYTAIIYHLAKLMKSLGFAVPSTIAFSGNGSKVVSVLSPNKSSLEKLTTVIFKLIFNDVDFKNDIKLIINSENPKEATCKGGLFLNREPDNINDSKAILLTDTLRENETYRDAEHLYNKVVDEVQKYADFLMLKIAKDKSISLSGDFGIDPSSLRLAISCFNENLSTYIEKGIASKLASGDVGQDDQIEETLFFYPIIGVMNNLSDKICEL